MVYNSSTNTVDYCKSCGWHHNGDEVKGLEILTDNYDRKYFICLVTDEKVFI